MFGLRGLVILIGAKESVLVPWKRGLLKTAASRAVIPHEFVVINKGWYRKIQACSPIFLM